MGLFQGCKPSSIFKINILYHINRLRKKNHTILLIYTKKFVKIQHRFLITPRKLGLEGYFLNMIKSIYQKPSVNIVLCGEMLNAFPLRRMSSFTTSFNIVLQVLTSTIRQKREIKDI